MKRCQVCGRQYDPAAADACPVAFRGKHIATDRPGTIYALCFREALEVRQADRGHVQPTRHYVGWTSQPVERRIQQHGVPVGSLVYTSEGTAGDELALKESGSCPRCGAAYAPECLGGVRRRPVGAAPDSRLARRRAALLARMADARTRRDIQGCQ